ncbi:ParB N-terminal domain-containing protein [Aminobacter sp. SR38]|jgi:DNA modification methylase|uniref:site-specific DNA-methyltransferase n=1 Tax=Aminobacter sp. SR38 TaxID=2774562 RepID=UPI001785C8D7|nr:DNA methyltransferase [Aminobacter sp. SR38]QOF69517.1 ParB N-terminal domain-containing protein [Aminobacter sp. SR38]
MSNAEGTRRLDDVPARSNHPEVEMVAIDRLIAPKRSLRKVTERHVESVVRSIGQFGFIGAIIVDENLSVITGQVRLEAARRLGYAELPVIRVDHLTQAQIRAYRIADNKLAEGVAWDESALRLEFEEILVLDTTFELELTGFSTGELDVVLDAQDGSDPADQMDVAPADVAVSRLGDLWQVGQHRLICGDAKLQPTYATLLRGETARLVAIDPPYNVGIASIMGLGETRYREFAEASGEMSPEQFQTFLATSLSAMSEHLVRGGLVYSFMDWKHIETLLAAGRGLDYELLNLAVWNKMKGGMGSLYRSAHELCAVFKKPGASHLNNIELGRHGRNRTNVWDIPGFSSFGRERNKRLADHPTVKPVELIADIIKDASRRGDIVIDGFCGSGTMLIAAEKTGRVARCVELDPQYVDVSLRRFEERFGIEAVHAETGLGFHEMSEMRRAENTGQTVTTENVDTRTGHGSSAVAPAQQAGLAELNAPAPRRRRVPPWLMEPSVVTGKVVGGRA